MNGVIVTLVRVPMNAPFGSRPWTGWRLTSGLGRVTILSCTGIAGMLKTVSQRL